MTMGAYLALFFLGTLFPRLGLSGTGLGPFTFGYPLLLAIPLAALATAGLAVALDLAVYRRLRDRGVAETRRTRAGELELARNRLPRSFVPHHAQWCCHCRGQ